jgi:hypothetical protein
MAATTIKGIDINGATKQIDYEALANKPTIPTTVAELIDAGNYITSAYVESILSASTEIPTFYPLGDEDEDINMDDIYSQCDELYGFGSANSGASASVLTFFNIWKDAPSVYRLYNSEFSPFFQFGYGADIDVHIQNVYSEDETTMESHYFSLNGLTRLVGEDSFSGHPFEYKAIIISFINGELYLVVGVPRYINVYDSSFGYLPITNRALKSLNVINLSDFYKIITYCAEYFASYSASTLDKNLLMRISDEDYKFLYSLPSIFTIEATHSYIPLFNVHDSVNSDSTRDVSYITTKYIFDEFDILSGYGFSNLYYYEIHSGSTTFWKLKVEAPFRSNSNIITATKNSDYSLLLDNSLQINAEKIPTFPIIKDKTYNEQPYIWEKNNKTYFSLNGISYEYYGYYDVCSAAPIQSSVAQPLLNYTFTLNTGGTFDAADSDIINDIVFKAINPSKSNLMIKVASGSSAYWFNSFGYDSGTGIISCDTYIPNLSSNLTLNIDSAGTGTLTMTQEKKHTQTIILNGGTVDLSCGDNVTYVASDLVSACTITCEQTPKTDGIENVVIFKTSAVTPSITISGGNCTMVWANNDVPSFKANKVYEVRATINDLGGTKYCMLAYAEYKAS